MTLQGGGLLAAARVPDAGGAIVGGGDDALAVGRERRAPHRAFMTVLSQPFGSRRCQDRPTRGRRKIRIGTGRCYKVHCGCKRMIAQPSENLAWQFTGIDAQGTNRQCDRAPDQLASAVVGFGQISLEQGVWANGMQLGLDPRVAGQEPFGLLILPGPSQVPDQVPLEIGFVREQVREIAPACGLNYRDHRGMRLLEPVLGSDPVAQIPEHIVVQPHGLPAAIKCLQHGQTVQPA